ESAGRPRVALRVPGLAYDVVCRTRDSDCLTLCNVFGEGDAELPVELVPRVIVDGGANAGYVSLYYASRYPRARIIGIEPDRSNFELAHENCAPYPQVEVIHAGLWSRDTTLEIQEPRSGWRSWALQTREAGSGAADGVEGISIPALLRRIGEETIDVLKLDIEGSEGQLFSDGPARWLAAVGVVVVEPHGDKAERTVRGALDRASFAQLNTEGHRLVFVNRAFRPTRGGRKQRTDARSSSAALV